MPKFKQLSDEEKKSCKKLGLKIKQARKEKRFSQTELAKRIGCSPTTVCHAENGKYRIKLFEIEKIAKELDKPLSYFIGRKSPVKQEVEKSDVSDRLSKIEQALEKLLVKEEKEPEEENKEKVYHVGDKFKYLGDDTKDKLNLFVIGVCSDIDFDDNTEVRLINVNSGRRFTLDTSIKINARLQYRKEEITEEQFSKLCDGNEKDFEQVYGEFVLKTND